MPRDPHADSPARRLALRAAQGDPDAFAELHRRLDRPLTTLFRRRGADPALADELVQRTWTRLWQAISEGRYRPEAAAVTTYAYAIAHKVWLQRFRDRPAGAAGSQESRVADEIDLTESLAQAELLEAVRDCLRSAAPLSVEERQMLEAVAAGASERQLSDVLGVAASTVHVRKKAALGKLAACLQRKGFRTEESE